MSRYSDELATFISAAHTMESMASKGGLDGRLSSRITYSLAVVKHEPDLLISASGVGIHLTERSIIALRDVLNRHFPDQEIQQ